MFLLDDMVLRTIGLSIPGVDLIWLFEELRDIAFREKYDPDKIRDQIKENRMLYEFGEVTADVYERKNAELTRKLNLAKRADSMGLEIRGDLLGGS